MRLKLFFSPSKNTFSESLNKKVNGFINNLLGNGNGYHGTFSDYSVSSLQGVKWNDDGTFTFPNGAFLYVSSENQEFINSIAVGLVSKTGLSVCDMDFISFEVCDYVLRKEYDIVRAISPIIISKERKMLTYKDDGFLELLREKSIKKLILSGIEERKAKSIKFTIFHPENAHTTCTKIGEAVNIGSKVMFLISGNKEARKALYTMGIGKCTGFGFGAVTVNNK